MFFVQRRDLKTEDEREVRRWFYRIAKSDDMTDLSLWHDYGLMERVSKSFNSFQYDDRTDVCVILLYKLFPDISI